MATAIQKDMTESTNTPPAHAPPPPAPSSKRRFVLPIVAVLAILAVIWGVKRWSYGRAHATTDNAQVDGHLIPISAKVGGYVTAVNVSENQDIKQGDVLATIDTAEYKVRLLQAQADLATAQAATNTGGNTGQAQAAVAQATGQRGSLEAQVGAARANQERALADLARFKELADKQIISKQQLDAAQASADAATANWQAAQRQASAAGATIVNAEAGVRAAQARLLAAQAAVQNAQLQLSYTRITSPVNGLVSKKLIEAGQLVQPGQQLLSIVADTGAWVTANFKETQLADLRVGQTVDIEVDAYGGAIVPGKIGSIGGATGAKFALLPPDNATGNFTKVVQRVPVRVVVTGTLGKDRPLRPGMSVVVHVATK
ncbi:MAG: HlyD family secretion protein [Gemmatimonadota bacterium]|nr:HlyD family secretion protein [Gemmatimonadota bacterium]